MSKKLITACMALFALAAFILPATASASPELTHPTGTRLNPTGKTCTTASNAICITGTNVGNALFRTDPASGTGTIVSECSKVVITGSLTKNNGTEIEGDIHTATFSGGGAVFNGMNECTSETLGGLTPTTNGENVDGENIENGTPWCLKSAAEDTFTVRGGLCTAAARSIKFILDSTLSGECKYERAAAEPIKGTFTTDSTGDALLTLTPGANTTFKRFAGGILCPSTGTLDMKFTLETDSEKVEPLYIS